MPRIIYTPAAHRPALRRLGICVVNMGLENLRALVPQVHAPVFWALTWVRRCSGSESSKSNPNGRPGIGRQKPRAAPREYSLTQVNAKTGREPGAPVLATPLPGVVKRLGRDLP